MAFTVNDGKSIGFMKQSFDKKLQRFERKYSYIGLTIEYNEKTNEPKLHLDSLNTIKHHGEIKSQLEKLENIDNKFEMSGVFMNSNNKTSVFFRFNDTIEYCSVDEVNTLLDKS